MYETVDMKIRFMASRPDLFTPKYHPQYTSNIDRNFCENVRMSMNLGNLSANT